MDGRTRMARAMVSPDQRSSFILQVTRIAERVGRIRNLSKTNPNILWLHGSMCGLIVSAYGRVHNYFSKCFEPSTITEDMFSDTLKPATDNLVAVMMAGERFVDWCKCEGHGHLNYDQELVWMQKALYGGLSSEPIDIHIHNFLLAMCTVGDAISSLVPTPGSHAHHLDPETFWMSGEARNPAYIFIDGLELEKAWNDDIRELKTYLEGIMDRNNSQLQASTGDGDHFKWHLANLLLQKLKDQEALCHGVIQADYSTSTTPHDGDPQGSSSSSVRGIPGIIVLDDSSAECFGKPPEILKPLYLTNHVAVHKARWSPAGSDKIFAQKRLSLAGKYGFESEALVHLRLHHPNIVQCLCAFVDSRTYGYILMELMDMNLYEYINAPRPNGMMSLAEKVYIMLQIAKGMEYLHSRGIMHRDLKPENVLITDSLVQPVEYDPHGASTSSSKYVQGLQLYESVHVKIADFNFARTIENVVRPGADLRYIGTSRVGTAMYRAPEVMRRDGQGGLKYSQEVDVYSFGAVCFMMFLIGSEEYEEGEDTLKKIQQGMGRPCPLNALKGKCPWYLQRWIEACLDPDPQARPTFKDICRVLRHLYSVVLRSGPTLPPFLSEAVDENTWRTVQEKVMQEMQKLESFKEQKEWRSHCSVVEIPYEMHVMNVMECVLNKALAPPANPKPKSGVLDCLLSCFQFCLSEAPIANRRAGIK